jgi:2'-5' RNA ligase
MSPPLILALQLNDEAFRLFDALRRQHFPPERNFILAHLTLFHALPGRREPQRREELRAVCAQQAPLPLRFPRLRSLGRGVAVEVNSPELGRLRQSLARRWADALGAQDRQGYRPHIMLQNKVSVAAARELLDHLRADWTHMTATGEGLLLWHYLGGPWRLVEVFGFGAVDS